MSKLNPYEIKTFDQLKKFAAAYGYKTNPHGKLRQQSWHGLAFDVDGRVVYLKNGAVICESGMSFENCAYLISIIGDPDKFNELKKQLAVHKEMCCCAKNEVLSINNIGLKDEINKVRAENEKLKQAINSAASFLTCMDDLTELNGKCNEQMALETLNAALAIKGGA